MTALSDEARREYFTLALTAEDVPVSQHAGLREYFVAHQPTGDFLRAVLENNLQDAALRADPDNRLQLRAIMMFLTHHCPPEAWGSAAAVDAWLRRWILKTPPADDDAKIALAMAKELCQLGPMELGLKPETVFQLVGLLQLARRHPALSAELDATITLFVTGARAYFAACPVVLDVIRRGDDPAEDR
jgi:hypothetical protein